MNTAGGSGKERDRGYTSDGDGLEVVAMIAQYDRGVSFRIQGKCTDWYFRGALGDSGRPVSTGNMVFGFPEFRSGG